MKYYLSILVLTIACFSACNDDHPRLELADAKKQIVQYYDANPEEIISNTTFEAVIRGKDSGYNKIALRQYINAGLLKLKEMPGKNSDSIYIYEIAETGETLPDQNAGK